MMAWYQEVVILTSFNCPVITKAHSAKNDWFSLPGLPFCKDTELYQLLSNWSTYQNTWRTSWDADFWVPLRVSDRENLRAPALAFLASSQVMVPSHTWRRIGVDGLSHFFLLLHTGRSATWLASAVLHWLVIQNTTPSQLFWPSLVVIQESRQHEWRKMLMKISPSCINLLICSANISQAFDVPGIVLDTGDPACLRHTWPLPVMCI